MRTPSLSTRFLRPDRLFLAVAALAALATAATAGGPPYGIPSGVMPWEFQKYRGYNEPHSAARATPPNPAAVTQAPAKFGLHLSHPVVKHEADDANQVILMAHLPEDAAIYFDGQPTKAAGTLRWFETPPLVPGHDYHYAVKVVWFEDGKWVTQSRGLTMRAGETHCIDVVPASEKAMAAEVAASLGKLSPEDRRLAEAQKVCVVQTDKRLGEMGTPVKVMVSGQPVFLCCGGCERAALSNPDRTLARAEVLKTKAAGTTAK